MSGLGRKTFAAGEVLRAADVNGYLMNQTVMNFAGTAARGSAIGTAVSEGMVSYLADSDFIEIYSGSEWLPAISATEWTSYTPTISSQNGLLNIGNGVVAFRYKRIGKTVFVIGRYTLGSTSVMGNTFDVTLPTDINSSILLPQNLGTATYWDSPGAIYTGWPLYLSGGVVRLVVSTVSGTRITNNELSTAVPFTWVSGDYVNLELTYEAS
jgi:hypothetical protein